MSLLTRKYYIAQRFVYLLCKPFSVTCSPKKAVGGTVIVREDFVAQQLLLTWVL